MKRLGQFMLAILIAGSFTGCKKKIYGCMDESALNYSSVANQDAKNCVYKNEEVTVSNIINNVSFVQNQNGNGYTATLTWSEITQDIIDNGAIEVLIGGNGEWTNLPFTYPSGYQQVSTTITAVYSVGKVVISAMDSDGTIGANPGTSDFKIVIMK